MVFQSYALYPHKIGVREHRLRPAHAQDAPRPRSTAACATPPASSPSRTCCERRPSQLSGGQRQRVALGRAMVRQPAVFLMDEPLSNLDAALRISMRAEIKHLHTEMQTTFVYVTHDQAEALTLADRIVVMNDGVIQQIGTPDEIYERPRNMFVASFLGNPPINYLQGAIEAATAGPAFRRGEMRVRAAAGRRCAHVGRRRREDVMLGIRPEDVSHARAQRRTRRRCSGHGRFRAAGRLRPLSRAQGRRLRRLRARRQGEPASRRRDRDARARARAPASLRQGERQQPAARKRSA